MMPEDASISPDPERTVSQPERARKIKFQFCCVALTSFCKGAAPRTTITLDLVQHGRPFASPELPHVMFFGGGVRTRRGPTERHLAVGLSPPCYAALVRFHLYRHRC